MPYAARQSPGRDRWTVYDTSTGWPAVLAGRPLLALPAGEAVQLADALNDGRIVIFRTPAAPGGDDDALCFGEP
jgi:hypothetical protein